MINNRVNKAVLLYAFIASLICFGSIYILSKSNIGIKKTITKSFVSILLPPKSLCRRPDGSTFIRDQLTKVHVDKWDNKSAYLNESDASHMAYISRNYSNLTEFIQNTRTAFMTRRLIADPNSIITIFRDPPYKDMIKPSCDGLWMEFGVFRGSTLSLAAKWKNAYCGNTSQSVYGFDTFTGLPTDWRPGFGRGTFIIPNGTKLSVPSNVILVKGLFIDTLPTQLRLIDREYQCKTPVSFVHIDCDIYDGARDVLFLLGSRFVPGTILVFDELFNYPSYEKHEIKALFEFLAGSNLRLIPLGTSGNIDLVPTRDITPQSFAFVIDFEQTEGEESADF